MTTAGRRRASGRIDVSETDPPAPRVVADGLTDDHGRYTIRRLSPGQYSVWLQLGRTGPDYIVGDIDLREGPNKLDIVSR